MRKDKKQIIGEEISDESIKLFLGVEPADDTPPSLHKLIKAYRGAGNTAAATPTAP
ncbi:PA4642 family protein, partial [Pseudomonas aeruginosa]|uniref:PA4642 family protein n=1 Tax=Pseudomonas aeruginosa TaxID=287 RepID=UPI0039688F19